MPGEAIATVKHYANLHSQGQVPDYEGLLEHAYRKLIKPGDSVLDIGAHGGRHTRPFLELIGPHGRLICFEPLPDKAEWLRHAFAGQPTVEVRQKALSQSAGTAEFLHVRNAPEESGLRERIYNVAAPDIERISVEVGTLNEEASRLRNVSYIKIDVEGAEIDCLKGGRETLRKFRPLISVEYGFPAYSRYGSEWSTLYDLAASLDYRTGDLFGNIVASREEWFDICDKAYWDYFLVPEEKVCTWQSALKGMPEPRNGSSLGWLKRIFS